MEELSEHPLCLSCLEPHREHQHFCDHCGAPLDTYAATAPLERIYATGHVLRTAVNGPRKRFVTVGLCLASAVFSIGGILWALEFETFPKSPRAINHLTVWVVIGFLAVMVPWRMASNRRNRGL